MNRVDVSADPGPICPQIHSSPFPSLLCLVKSWYLQTSFLNRPLCQQFLSGLAGKRNWKEIRGQEEEERRVFLPLFLLGEVGGVGGLWKHLFCCFCQSGHLVLSFFLVTSALDSGSNTFPPLFSSSGRFFCSHANLWFAPPFPGASHFFHHLFTALKSLCFKFSSGSHVPLLDPDWYKAQIDSNKNVLNLHLFQDLSSF